jgi:hypothetical protein
MAHYYLETDDRELLRKLLHTNVCKECNGELEAFFDMGRHLPYLQCKANPKHEGIAKPYKAKPTLEDFNIETRREIVENQTGKGTAVAIPTSGQLTQNQAMHILQLVYPKAPEDEILRCAILCRDFGLHPLMKEVYLIPFKDKSGKDNYTTVIGINATRKMMAQRGTYSYIGNTPRVMTEKEQKDIFGEVDERNIRAITKLRTRDGEEAQGYGSWPKEKEPYGTDKGNTKANMAFIRSERNAFSRLFTDAIPQGVEVVDEAYVDVPDVGKVIEKTGEIVKEEPEPPPEATESKISPVEEETIPTVNIDPDWLIESVNKLKWNLLEYLKTKYGIIAQGKETLIDVVNKLSPEQSKELVAEIEDRLDMK